MVEYPLELGRAVGGGLHEELERITARPQAQTRGGLLLGEVEEHEFRERALAFEREGGEGLDRGLVQAALSLDEALHVDLGDRREERRALDVAVDGEAQRH